MGSPVSPQRRIVPPAVPSPGERSAAQYTPPKYERPRMARGNRNLIVWSLCAITIIVAVLAFIYFMVPPEMQGILNALERR
jgi:hypothetical protein